MAWPAADGSSARISSGCSTDDSVLPRPRRGAKIWLLLTLESWLRSTCGDRNAASSGIGKQG